MLWLDDRMSETATNNVLNLLQALHLMGVLPALFLLFFLLVLFAKGNRQAVIPAIYFLSLACGFILPLASIYPPLSQNLLFVGVLLLGESLLMAASFLLVMQFLLGRTPPLIYWLVFAIPFVGGSGLIYASLLSPEACTIDEVCRDVGTYKALYNIFSAALIFLLLVYYSSRGSEAVQSDEDRRHKYWLIISLILLNLCVLAIDLARIAGRLSQSEADIILVIFKLAFIYLVITSLFRVFYPRMAQEVVTFSSKPQHDPAQDQPVVDMVVRLLSDEKLYREMRLNRAAFAEKVGVSEHQLSRIVNHYFGKSVVELINHHRIEDAKRRLRDEPQIQITAIGFEAGFNSIASFNRVFKEKVGVSPTQWREGAGG
jgi:AraC-like DNA-binding protein